MYISITVLIILEINDITDSTELLLCFIIRIIHLHYVNVKTFTFSLNLKKEYTVNEIDMHDILKNVKINFLI